MHSHFPQGFCNVWSMISSSKELPMSIPQNDDKEGFQIHIKEKPMTRRGMLSSLSSIYDPLELSAPFMLEGRRIIQSLCYQNLDWDEQIPDSMARQWAEWKSDLLLLEDIKVERCFKPISNLVKLENTVCIICLMHQSMDMVSVATFDWLIKMIKFISV